MQVLDLMEAISSVPRERIRIMDVRGFKDAGHELEIVMGPRLLQRLIRAWIPPKPKIRKAAWKG